MRKIGYLALAASALALSACVTNYGSSGLLGGYSEKQVEPGVWRVKATTNGFSRPNSSLTMAMYRSAELARAAGFEYFEVIETNQRLLPLVAGNMVWSSGGGEVARLRIRGAHEPDGSMACEADRAACRTYKVDEVMRRLGPLLNRPANGGAQ